MRNRFLLFGTIGVCIALASCTDVVGLPGSAPAMEFGVAKASLSILSGTSSINVLSESPTAPPLEVYGLEFWVVQGAGKTVLVNYRPGSTSVAKRFMRLVIPKGTQLYRPDGSRVANGDSVRVTVTIDRQQLLVTFGPNGLVFGSSKPTLRIYYANANLDVNAKGQVDQLDTDLIQSLLVISYRSQAGDPWSIPSDQAKSREDKYIEISVPHFSDYAVSW
jgi:hypothetical protein